MQDNDDNEYPEKRPLDSALELAKDVAGSLFPGAPAITALIKTAHSRRLEEFHRRTAQRLDALEQSNVTTLLDRAIGGDHEAKEEVLSTYATISRLVSEAMDEDKRMAWQPQWHRHFSGLRRRELPPRGAFLLGA